jgi:K+-transporting ATPase ATPase C chain
MFLKSTLRPALSLFLLLSLVTGLAYPMLVTLSARLLFPDQAAGSLIVRDGQLVGSRLIGQTFDQPGFFRGRPSATGPAPYNGQASGGSNLGPTNPALAQALKERAAALTAVHPERTDEAIPADLLTASASGLDPHISPAAANWQIERVARERQLSVATVTDLVSANTVGRLWGIFGEPVVNVLALNLALDKVKSL